VNEEKRGAEKAFKVPNTNSFLHLGECRHVSRNQYDAMVANPPNFPSL